MSFWPSFKKEKVKQIIVMAAPPHTRTVFFERNLVTTTLQIWTTFHKNQSHQERILMTFRPSFKKERVNKNAYGPFKCKSKKKKRKKKEKKKSIEMKKKLFLCSNSVFFTIRALNIDFLQNLKGENLTLHP